MKVVVTGGGTGGHIYPALAVAEALKRIRPDVEARYIGGTSGPEAQIVPAAGLPFYGVTTRKLRKLLSPGTAGVLLALWKGYREAAACLREFAPEVVISTGGYVAAAAALAAARQRIPTVILAPDAVPGRTNRLVSRRATRICVWFEETARRFPAEKTVATGVPIRADIISPKSPAEARRALGLAEEPFTVLVLGGSQGAQRLNEIVLDTVVRMAKEGELHTTQILHQTGERNFQAICEAAKEKMADLGLPDPKSMCFLRAYFDSEQIPLAYRAADLVICRCGVSTLAEVTANGLPSILVPLPTAYADHQTANARAIVRGKGGILLPQDSLTPERLASTVRELRNDPERRARMSAASFALGKPDAADRVARIALTVE